MKKGILYILILFSLVFVSMACTAHRNCPGTGSTGNYALNKKSPKSTHCPGTGSTGTHKPKISRKPQDGLMSRRMIRKMYKDQD